MKAFSSGARSGGLGRKVHHVIGGKLTSLFLSRPSPNRESSHPPIVDGSPKESRTEGSKCPRWIQYKPSGALAEEMKNFVKEKIEAYKYPPENEFVDGRTLARTLHGKDSAVRPEGARKGKK